jgi:hypothetical protein
MNAITLDSNLRHQLPDLTQPFAIRDESGQIVGRYIPASAKLEPPLSPEEIERRKQNKGKTYTTAEALAHLEKL